MNTHAQRPTPRPVSQIPASNNFAEDDGEDAEVVVTTKTTTVMDSLGRTRSITTETIKTMPDGTNIIETITTNTSRPTSRNSSLRNNSLHGHNGGNYNLDKIDEDLQDFDYTYLDHQQHHQVPPRLNNGNRHSSYTSPQHSPEAPRQQLSLPNRAFLRADDRANSLSSSASPKRLKSILKNSPSTNNLQQGDMGSSPREDHHFRDAEDSLRPNRLEPLALPRNGQHSATSGANSIKFLETVETIPFEGSHNLAELKHEESLKKEEEKKKNVDLYSQAMKVAMAKVYGLPDAPFAAQFALESVHASPKADLTTLADKKLKKDSKREKIDAAGVNKNYIYENHHRDFSKRSLRGALEEEQSTRKERAKEERKHLKEEEKRNAELLKAAEQEKKREEKLEAKKEKKSYSFFGRRKRKSSLDGESTRSSIEQHDLTYGDGLTSAAAVISPQSTDSAPVSQHVYLSPTQHHFVDVPEIPEEEEEDRGRAGVIEEHPVETSFHSYNAIPTSAPVTPEVYDLQPIEELHGASEPVVPITEDKLPTLVSSREGHPVVLTNESINDSVDVKPEVEQFTNEVDRSFEHDVTTSTVAEQSEYSSPASFKVDPEVSTRANAIPKPQLSDIPDTFPASEVQSEEAEPSADAISVPESKEVDADPESREESVTELQLPAQVDTVEPEINGSDSIHESLAQKQVSGLAFAQTQPLELEEEVAENTSTGPTPTVSAAPVPATPEVQVNAASVPEPPSEHPGRSHFSDISEVSIPYDEKPSKPKVKKSSKFKKMIDKYFINTYHR